MTVNVKLTFLLAVTFTSCQQTSTSEGEVIQQPSNNIRASQTQSHVRTTLLADSSAVSVPFKNETSSVVQTSFTSQTSTHGQVSEEQQTGVSATLTTSDAFVSLSRISDHIRSSSVLPAISPTSTIGSITQQSSLYSSSNPSLGETTDVSIRETPSSKSTQSETLRASLETHASSLLLVPQFLTSSENPERRFSVTIHRATTDGQLSGNAPAFTNSRRPIITDSRFTGTNAFSSSAILTSPSSSQLIIESSSFPLIINISPSPTSSLPTASSVSAVIDSTTQSMSSSSSMSTASKSALSLSPMHTTSIISSSESLVDLNSVTQETSTEPLSAPSSYFVGISSTSLSQTFTFNSSSHMRPLVTTSHSASFPLVNNVSRSSRFSTIKPTSVHSPSDQLLTTTSKVPHSISNLVTSTPFTAPESFPTNTQPSTSYPVEKKCKIILWFIGDCSKLLNCNSLRHQFLAQLIDIMCDDENNILSSMFSVDTLTCNPMQTKLELKRVQFQLLEHLKEKMNNLSITIMDGDDELRFSLNEFHQINTCINSEANKVRYLEFNLDLSDIILMSVAAFGVLLLVTVCTIYGFRQIFLRKRGQSFSLSETPHVNLKLADFTLTKIPRPHMIYHGNGESKHAPEIDSLYQHAKRPVIPTAWQTSKDDTKTNRLSVNADDIRIRMADVTDGLMVGVTSRYSQVIDDANDSHNANYENMTQGLLEESKHADPQCGVTNPGYHIESVHGHHESQDRDANDDGSDLEIML